MKQLGSIGIVRLDIFYAILCDQFKLILIAKNSNVTTQDPMVI